LAAEFLFIAENFEKGVFEMQNFKIVNKFLEKSGISLILIKNNFGIFLWNSEDNIVLIHRNKNFVNFVPVSEQSDFEILDQVISEINESDKMEKNGTIKSLGQITNKFSGKTEIAMQN